MEPDEIRAEIELRKKRAIDLKLREALWSLYYVQKGPDAGTAQIAIGPAVYDLIYKEGPPSSSIHPKRDRGFEVQEVRILATLTLISDNQPIFECEINKYTLWLSDGPLPTSELGSVTRFIEGPWVSELTNLQAKREAEQKALWDEKQKAKLDAMKDRFGL